MREELCGCLAARQAQYSMDKKMVVCIYFASLKVENSLFQYSYNCAQ